MHPISRVKNTERQPENKVSGRYGIHLDRSTIGAHLVEVFLAPTAFVLLLLALFIMYLGYKSRQYAKLEEDCPCLLEDAEQVSIF